MAMTPGEVGIADMCMTLPSVTGCTSESLVDAMCTRSALREQYRQLSAQAAQLERDGQYDEAMRTWAQAAGQALHRADRHWCESRAQWCEQCLRRRD